MKQRRRLGLLLSLVAGLAAPALAAMPAGSSDIAVELKKVQKLRTSLAKVAEHGSLPAALTSEARAVAADAAKAVESKPTNGSALDSVLQEYKHFVADLMNARTTLANTPIAAPTVSESRLNALVPVLEGKVRKVLGHIEKDSKGLNSTQESTRQSAIHALTHALAEQNVTEKAKYALDLHAALATARDFEVMRTAALDKEQVVLQGEIDAAQVHILYMMLQQRRKLPIRGQLAILKRHQFKTCSWAQKLLKEYKDGKAAKPLFEQLEDMLPQKLKQSKLASKASGGHLEAAGSDGRVHIVSSALKNSVQKMLGQLDQARNKLSQIAGGHQGSAVEAKRAKEILPVMDALLAKARSTKDLKLQLETMDEVQKKLGEWASQEKIGK